MSDSIARTRRLFGHNLKRLRTKAEISQQSLSDATGVKRTRISEYESGSYACTIDMLARFADALDVPVAAFFDETEFDEKRKRNRR